MSALQRLSNLSSPLMLLQSDILDKSAEDEDVKTTMTRFSFVLAIVKQTMERQKTLKPHSMNASSTGHARINFWSRGTQHVKAGNKN